MEQRSDEHLAGTAEGPTSDLDLVEYVVIAVPELSSAVAVADALQDARRVRADPGPRPGRGGHGPRRPIDGHRGRSPARAWRRSTTSTARWGDC